MANIAQDENNKIKTLTNFFPGNPALDSGNKTLKVPNTPD